MDPLFRLDRVYGGWAGRLWPDIAVAVPSPSDPAVAYAVSSAPGPDRRGARWHRLDLPAGASRESHDLGVTTAVAVDISDDGGRVAFVGSWGDGSLRVRTSAGRFVWRRRGGWRHARFVPGEDRLLAWSVQGVVAEFDASTGEELFRTRGFPPLSLSADRRLVSLRPDRDHVALLDRPSGELVARWSAGPLATVPSPLPGELLCLGPAPELYCLEAGRRRPRWTVERATADLYGAELVLPADGETVVVSSPGRLSRHGVEDGRPLGAWSTSRASARLSRDGRRAVLWSAAVFSDWQAGTERRTGAGHDTSIAEIAASPDGALFATRANDRTIRVWDARTGAQRLVLDSGYGSWSALHFTPDGRRLLATGLTDRGCWDLRAGTPLHFPYPLPPQVRYWRPAPDGARLWVDELDGRWGTARKLISTADGAVLWQGHGDERGVAFTAEAAVIVTREPGPSIVWLDGGAPRRVTLRGLPACHPEMAFSGDGGAVAVRLGGEVRVFDTRTGRLTGRVEAASRHLPVFVGPRWLVLVEGSVLTAYDMPKLRPVGQLSLGTVEDEPQTVHAGPDGASVLVGTRRGVLLRFTCS